MDKALDVAPADYWRYYLIANAPESADSNFTWEHFAGVINKDLADVLGNFADDIDGLGNGKTFTGDADRRANDGDLPLGEFDVDGRSGHLNNFSVYHVSFYSSNSYSSAAEPLTTSMISFVIVA